MCHSIYDSFLLLAFSQKYHNIIGSYVYRTPKIIVIVKSLEILLTQLVGVEMRVLFKSFFFLFYLILIIFILLEILVRFLGYSKKYLIDPIYMPFSKNEEIPYVLKPNLKNARAQGNILINTDEFGLRSLIPGAHYEEKKPDEYRIAFLGDSFTFGHGVANNETYPQIVENDLNALPSPYRVKVLNFGVDGYNVKTMTDTLRYWVLSLKPDLVIMGIIYDDFDLMRTGVIDKYGYIVNRLSTNVVGDFTKSFLRNLHLGYLIRDMLFKARTPAKSKEAPDANAVEVIPPSYQYVVAFRDFAQAHGLPYLIVTLPAKYPGDERIAVIQKQFSKDKIKYYDIFFLAQSISLKDFGVSSWDSHPSPLVQRKIGELLSEYIWENYLKTPAHP